MQCRAAVGGELYSVSRGPSPIGSPLGKGGRARVNQREVGQFAGEFRQVAQRIPNAWNKSRGLEHLQCTRFSLGLA